MTNTSGTTIDINHLSKSFGDTKVLQDINLFVESGEFVAIVGKSGCGKSTLLRLIAGLEKKTTGELLLNGQTALNKNEGTRVLFQEPRLLPWKSVEENIAICALDNSKESVANALASVGLEEKAGEWPNNLSGGQKQRVALARALSSKAHLLLLDEPLGALDALTRIDMQRLIEGLWEKIGFTALLVTHDVSEAVALADRVILIEEGEITLNIKIPLSRPRIRNNDFMYYESKILKRVLGEEVTTDQREYQVNI